MLRARHISKDYFTDFRTTGRLVFVQVDIFVSLGSGSMCIRHDRMRLHMYATTLSS